LIRTRLQDELLELQERLKRTIIFVSHDLDEAFKLGDKIVIMEGGRIVQSGEPRAIFSNPVNQYVADFVQHMNPLSVLTAQDIMEPIKGRAPSDVVSTETPLSQIMDQLDSSIDAVAVHDANGEPVGQINPQSIVNALNK
jgi:glycine betaine/proline transport system ATP-binding protein